MRSLHIPYVGAPELAGGLARMALMSFSVSAATVTLDHHHRVLLIQRADTGEWQIPGGVVEIGEQPVDAACRETLEESGVEVAPHRLTGIYTHSTRGIVAMVFLASPVSGAASPQEESKTVEWVDIEEARNRLSPVFRVRLEDALVGSVHHCLHDGTQVRRVWAEDE